ncbi:MAG: DUF1622 domain-containing protein [Microcystaceae cyanobacterium]
MEHLEHNLAILAGMLKLLLEGIALLCILVGLFKCAQMAFFQPRRSRLGLLPSIRIAFGRWLSLALEFQLGADIVNTAITPTLEDLAQLAALAVIRTFLNYFLSRELHELNHELALTQERKQATSLAMEKGSGE